MTVTACLFCLQRISQMLTEEGDPVIIVNTSLFIAVALLMCNTDTVFADQPVRIAIFMLQAHADIIDSLLVNLPAAVRIEFAVLLDPWLIICLLYTSRCV